ncbi:MAG: haloacid dehalogenase-like hydrolase [Polyangiaceae bacterium]|jgi:phosphoserine phosphatase
MQPASGPASKDDRTRATYGIRYAPSVQHQDADAVCARIEALACAAPGGVIATDGDGTLWSGDVGEDLFHAFLSHGHVEPPALEALRQTARQHALSDAGGGSDIARRIYRAYLDGGFPEERICEIMTWCFAGWSRSAVRAFARDIVRRSQIVTRLHPELVRVLDRMRAARLEIQLVSASPFAVVAEAGSLVGFDEDHVVAAHALYRDGVMLPGVDRPIPYAAGKVTRLRERIPAGATLYAAFGDNAFDLAMLATAHVAVAVRPKDRLRQRAAEVPGMVELAR